MELPNSIIQKFVQATNDTTEVPKEDILYGTIYIGTDGIETVILDGTDQRTPVISTVKLKTGDRVSVLIKNHRAIVTGNISKPSLNDDSVLNTPSSFDVEYAQNNSNTEPPAEDSSDWNTVAPPVVTGMFIWSRTKTVLNSGVVTYSVPFCLSSSSEGRGIKSIKEQFYLSTSKTEQIGGSWKYIPDAWSKDHYMWTRSEITYSDDEVMHTEPLCSSEWEAANDAYDRADSAYGKATSAEEAVNAMEKTLIIDNANSEIRIDGTDGDTLARFNANGVELGGEVSGSKTVLSRNGLTAGQLNSNGPLIFNSETGSSEMPWNSVPGAYIFLNKDDFNDLELDIYLDNSI